jgi:hypothetical protein
MGASGSWPIIHVSGIFPYSLSGESVAYPPQLFTRDRENESIALEVEWCIASMDGPVMVRTDQDEIG